MSAQRAVTVSVRVLVGLVGARIVVGYRLDHFDAKRAQFALCEEVAAFTDHALERLDGFLDGGSGPLCGQANVDDVRASAGLVGGGRISQHWRR
jgi:hypothetical protein